jgi:hypothetical protein
MLQLTPQSRVFLATQPVDLVAYLRPADNSIGPLLSRLRGAQQPVVRPRNTFSAPRSHLLARL